MHTITLKALRATSMRQRATFLVLVTCIGLAAEASATQGLYDSHHQKLRSLLMQPEDQIDLLTVKLAVDAMIDPSSDQRVVSKQIDKMAKEIVTELPIGASDLVKLKALRSYLYQPSPYSGRKAFRYNFEDDRNPRSKLLSVYLTTYRGNCISMPILFVVLGHKLGIPLTLSTAPEHLYVKFQDGSGAWHGIEATSGGGWADDAWQSKQFPSITPAAIANEVYLQPLTKKQSAAVIAETLLEYYENKRTTEAEEARIKLAFLILENYPRDVAAMVHAYAGSKELRRRLFVEKFPAPADIPNHLRDRFLELEAGWLYWGTRAKKLGFQSPTPEMEAQYRARISEAKATSAALDRQLLRRGP